VKAPSSSPSTEKKKKAFSGGVAQEVRPPLPHKRETLSSTPRAAKNKKKKKKRNAFHFVCVCLCV
jgi:hypothetical protein